jgi:hypothetical protein
MIGTGVSRRRHPDGGGFPTLHEQLVQVQDRIQRTRDAYRTIYAQV